MRGFVDGKWTGASTNLPGEKRGFVGLWGLWTT